MKNVANDWRRVYRRERIDCEQKTKWISTSNVQFLELLKRYVRRDALILEAGCGYGVWCIYFNKYHRASCVGIDVVVEPLRRLEFYLKDPASYNTFAISADVTRLPFRKETFNIVTSFGVIEHFRGGSQVFEPLNEASRVLQDRGFLILTIPNFAATLRNKLAIAVSRGRFAMYHNPYTRSGLVNAFGAVDSLSIVETGYTPFGHLDLILNLVKALSLEKVIYFLYHTIWRVLNHFATILNGEDYQNPIYIVAQKAVVSNNVEG